MSTVQKLVFIPCPRCGKKTAYTGNPTRPFCSEACKNIDLAQWDEECYTIPGQHVPTTPDSDELD